MTIVIEENDTVEANDAKTQSLKADGARTDRQQEIIEIEENDTVEVDEAMEDDDDDKWAKQELIEDTTLVAVDQTTSLITSTASPTPTSLISGIASPTRHQAPGDSQWTTNAGQRTSYRPHRS